MNSSGSHLLLVLAGLVSASRVMVSARPYMLSPRSSALDMNLIFDDVPDWQGGLVDPDVIHTRYGGCPMQNVLEGERVYIGRLFNVHWEQSEEYERQAGKAMISIMFDDEDRFTLLHNHHNTVSNGSETFSIVPEDKQLRRIPVEVQGDKKGNATVQFLYYVTSPAGEKKYVIDCAAVFVDGKSGETRPPGTFSPNTLSNVAQQMSASLKPVLDEAAAVATAGSLTQFPGSVLRDSFHASTQDTVQAVLELVDGLWNAGDVADAISRQLANDIWFEKTVNSSYLEPLIQANTIAFIDRTLIGQTTVPSVWPGLLDMPTQPAPAPVA